MHTEHLKEKKAKEDTETYEEATNTLSRLLNKYGEGKNRYQNLHRMISSRTYPTKRAGQGEKVQKKAEGDTEQNNNLQVEKKVEERKKAEGPDEGNKAVTDEGGDRNKDGRSKADDRNKTLTSGADQVIHQVQKGLHRQKGQLKSKDRTKRKARTRTTPGCSSRPTPGRSPRTSPRC